MNQALKLACESKEYLEYKHLYLRIFGNLVGCADFLAQVKPQKAQIEQAVQLLRVYQASL